MSTASKVAARKEKYPHLYCPKPRCLWHTGGGYCPRHKRPDIDKCPYCGTERKLPAYVYAHWTELFTVICENSECKKKYSFFQGHTDKLTQGDTK
jgi:hypothetical protein